ncbi:MAG: efflux RND transporter permease subunit, partial [Myxococcota bacterium]
LGLFLDTRLSFWVTLGIPISFLGSIMLMPAMDVSVNMISLFAFIITLGIVVDDAIVVGENIYEMRQRGMSPLEAAVHGAQTISMPVVFSVLTTVAAFMPMFLVPGASGKFFRVLPAIVVCVLVMSLIESLFVLPAHLGHSRARRGGIFSAVSERVIGVLELPGRRFSSWLMWFINGPYARVLRAAVNNRSMTICIGIAILVSTFGFIGSGRMNFSFLPKVETDNIAAKATLPFGVAIEETERVQARLIQGANEVIAESGEQGIAVGLYSQIGTALNTAAGPNVSVGVGGGTHLTGAQVFLVPSDQRILTAGEFAKRWREKVQDIVGLESLTFAYSTGPSSGAAIEIQLIHDNLERLEAAAADLAQNLRSYAGVKDIDDGFSGGKPQLSFKLTPEGRSLGLTALEVGRQVRAAFYGAEVLRQQRGRDEVKVMARLPKSERESRYAIESMMIRTPEGGRIPLSQVASVDQGTSYTDITRADGRRKVSVTADVIAGVANPNKVLASLKAEVLPELIDRHPGLAYSFEGNRARSDESLAALQSGFYLALFIIYALLAIPFKSYVQPLVVMSAIPFGIVGAVAGHLIMGYDLSLISVFGIVAVSGIVVNDSLVLVHAANERRGEGHTSLDAIQWAGRRRFRPIILTSLTTFFGLMPMILETSVQARFLIPMAISLAFGILFATSIILLLVPSLYMVVEDLRRFFSSKPASA